MISAATPRVVLVSMWRNDADKGLLSRAEHLLAKTYPALRWVWVVGDSTDETPRLLELVARQSRKPVTIVHGSTGILGEDSATRLVRMSMTWSRGLDAVNARDDYVVSHESDLQSPPDLVERFLSTGHCPVAGWVTLEQRAGEPIFYDTFGYRCVCCEAISSNFPPFLHGYTPDVPFEVASVGSAWMFHAVDIAGGPSLRVRNYGVVELCRKLRSLGRRVWVDPTIPIVQPRALWTSHAHAPEPRGHEEYLEAHGVR